ncbi:MAG: hypothetical protein B6I26_03605 [Desulfobacteraceae bacterium 4572_130]|nr:MAG: hypothetical protein B6I26_03605 [Desulfobacteraceae bacterium 4572_130]
MNNKKGLLWNFYHYSGLRFIWYKINPPLQKKEISSHFRRPATFFLWVLGIYIALFGIASNKYENRADKIENRINAIYAQISKDMKIAFERIPDVQNMPCPYEPNILNPLSIIKSFMPVVTGNEYKELKEKKEKELEGKEKKNNNKIKTWIIKKFYLKDIKYNDGVQQLKQLVEDWAGKTKTIKHENKKEKKVGELYGFDLNNIHLENADLYKAHLENANLILAHLENAILVFAHLENANLNGAHLENANLYEAHLKNADLSFAHLKNADFSGAHLEYADLIGTNLENADFSGAHLEYADLIGTNLENATLILAHLEYADLREAHLENVRLYGAHLENTLFSNADFKDIKGLTAKQLSKAFSLYGVKNLDKKLKQQVKQINPKLFEPNYKVWECNDKNKGLWWRKYLKKQNIIKN